MKSATPDRGRTGGKAADEGDAVAGAATAVKMDGRFIFNRLIQTGSIGGKLDRIEEVNPETIAGLRKRVISINGS